MKFGDLRPGCRFYFGGREHTKLRRVISTSLGACADCTNPENLPGNSISLCDGELHFFEKEDNVEIRGTT